MAYGSLKGGGSELVGSLTADLRHGGPFPVTSFTAEGTRCVLHRDLVVQHPGPTTINPSTPTGTNSQTHQPTLVRHSRGRVSIDNFVVPFFGHKITVTAYPGKDGGGSSSSWSSVGSSSSSSSSSISSVGSSGGGLFDGHTRHVSVYGGGETNYHYQLDRFVRDVKVLKGLEVPGW